MAKIKITMFEDNKGVTKNRKSKNERWTIQWPKMKDTKDK